VPVGFRLRFGLRFRFGVRCRRIALVVLVVLEQLIALGGLEEVPAEVVGRLPDRPVEVDVAVVADVIDLYTDVLADLPTEALEPSVEFAPVEETGDVADVDEHAEIGVAVDAPDVETPRC